MAAAENNGRQTSYVQCSQQQGVGKPRSARPLKPQTTVENNSDSLKHDTVISRTSEGGKGVARLLRWICLRNEEVRERADGEGNSRGGATKKRKIARTSLPIKLHVSQKGQINQSARREIAVLFLAPTGVMGVGYMSSHHSDGFLFHYS